MSDIPVWDQSSVYADFADPRYGADQKALTKTSQKILKLLKNFPRTKKEPSKKDQRAVLAELLPLFDRAGALAEQLGAFAYMLYSVNTRDEEASRQLGLVEELTLPLQDAQVQFRKRWADSKVTTKDLLSAFPKLKPYRLSLQEDRFLARRQMSEAEESLAADLGRSGGDAWGRLQSSISSTLKVTWDEKKGTTKTMTELRQLAYDRKREVRQKAFELELKAWKSVEIPVAASLNGVKGFAVTLNRRRGWKTPLELSALQARLSPKALEALISVLKESLPLFHGYLKTKAKVLKIPRLGFSDLFAPVGKDDSHYTWSQTRDFIVDRFAGFSQGMADFAALAFQKNWIHARPLEGKVGGAYCTSLPLSREPRVLCNFDGTFGELKTLAHELGHAWHFWLLKDKAHVYHEYPMTLAETASIFAETIVFEEALTQASPQAGLFLVEQNLQDATQVLVDILSRFLFESAVFERRKKNELSPSEFCQLMVDAQKETYGPGLDEAQLHPYMWAVKGHYYSPGLAFYNYPYAFGQLFSLALYKLSKKPGFVQVYEDLLKGTGVSTANQLASRAGFDLEDKDFWRQGVKVIEGQIADFEGRTRV